MLLQEEFTHNMEVLEKDKDTWVSVKLSLISWVTWATLLDCCRSHFPIKQENEARCIFPHTLGIRDSFENLQNHTLRKMHIAPKYFCLPERDSNMKT